MVYPKLPPGVLEKSFPVRVLNVPGCHCEQNACHSDFQNAIERNFVFFDKVETNRTCSVCFDFVKRTKFRPTLLPKTQQCHIVTVLVTKSTVASTKSSVASTLLMMWTGLSFQV